FCAVATREEIRAGEELAQDTFLRNCAGALVALLFQSFHAGRYHLARDDATEGIDQMAHESEAVTAHRLVLSGAVVIIVILGCASLVDGLHNRSRTSHVVGIEKKLKMIEIRAAVREQLRPHLESAPRATDASE